MLGESGGSVERLLRASNELVEEIIGGRSGGDDVVVLDCAIVAGSLDVPILDCCFLQLQAFFVEEIGLW